MMIAMAGKRLAAAGTLVAAVAATAALWVAPQASLAAQSRGMQSRTTQSRTLQLVAFRDAQTGTPTSAVALSKPRSAAWSPVVGLTAAGGTLFALVLVGVAGQRRRSAVTVRARAPYRGRAPPAPPPPHTARVRDR